MAEPRLIGKRNGLKRPAPWAPRALAVVSCALALLAAQPAGQTAPATRGRAAMVKDAGVAAQVLGVALPKSPALSTKTEKSRGITQPRVSAIAAQRLHILATMEIFQRLLTAELNLQPATTHWIMAVSVLWYEPIWVGIVEMENPINAGAEPHSGLPPPAERAFAIEHCLLAPPIS